MAGSDTDSPSPARVAFHGERGAFSEEAVCALWPEAWPAPRGSLAAVLRDVETGAADAGVLPVENTVAGGVVASYDALASASGVHAVAETVLAVEQCLLAPPGAALEQLTSIESHPVALMQCAAFLGRLPRVRQLAATDTATAARDVAAAGDRTRAAIAGRRAAARYGLAILAAHIEDRRDNQTRFLGVTRRPAILARGVPARTTLLFMTANQPGALIAALEPIARHGLNLSRLESRPTGEPWTYRFFADVDHPAGDPRLDDALTALRSATQSCRTIGTYRRANP